MLFKILKKDLRRRKGVNCILFLFIVLATVFLASSVNNILVVSSAMNYYLDYANVPDINLIMMGEEDKENIGNWLDGREGVEDYAYSRLLSLPYKTIEIEKNGERSAFEAGGANIYLGSQETAYNKVYDSDGNEFELKDDEVGVSKAFLKKSGLAVGDKIIMKPDGEEKELTIRLATKDAAFGSDMIGMTRFIVNENNMEKLSEKLDVMGMYYIMADDADLTVREIDNEAFETVINDVNRDTYKMAYSFDMIMAALLIAIGICLILIALLVLRFTLVFTMEEDYQEIGIMKATGYREGFIKTIYLVKYLALVLAGSAAGFLISIPVSTGMIKSVSQNMLMENTSANLWSNFVSAGVIVVLVLAFCYFCTRRLNKISAIAAIRGGHNGERYSRRKGLLLHRRKRMPVNVYLGANDILSNVKRYLILIITFCLSFVLITIPLNTLNTMGSSEMAGKFLLSADSAAFVNGIEDKGESDYTNTADLEKGLTRVEKELQKKGYDAKLSAMPIFFFKYIGEGDSLKNNILTCQLVGNDTEALEYKQGSMPELDNEIAFSEIVMEENGWQIGDAITAKLGGEDREFIITGAYSDYMQLGRSARMNQKIDLSEEWMSEYWTVSVDFETDMTQEEAAAKLSKEFPEYEWTTAQQFVDKNVGGIQDSLKALMIPMTAMLCAVIMLITLLMEKLFIVREKGEIAMMKSIGCRNGSIRGWQMMRMACVVVISMLVAVPLSLISNTWVLKPIFAIMGADVAIQVVPWQVYGVYPGILLLGILLATAFATKGVMRIHIRELNNLE